MILTTTIASIAISLAAQGTALTLHCPVMGGKVSKGAEVIHYNGVRYETCCGGCAAGFEKNPSAVLKAEKLKGKTVGVSLFDPVAGERIEAKESKLAPSVYNGVAFYFKNEKNKNSFDADPKKFGSLPEKEALYCAVMGHGIDSHAEAGAYVDHSGVRYYTCCLDCQDLLKANPSKFVGKASAAVKAPSAHIVKGSSDKASAH